MMSRALPWGVPSTTSYSTTSPSSFWAASSARLPPIWPAPMRAIFLRAMVSMPFLGCVPAWRARYNAQRRSLQRRDEGEESMKIPPGPPDEPFVLRGLLRLGRDPLGFFERLAREYGDLVHFKIGPRHLYLVIYPETPLERLVGHGRGPAGSGVASPRPQPRLSQPAFHAARLAGYAETMVARALRARDSVRAGEELDLNALLMELTLGIAGVP